MAYASEAYDFESFAPKKKQVQLPESETRFEPRIVRPARKAKSKAVGKAAYRAKIRRIIIASVLIFSLLGVRIYMQVTLTSKMRRLDDFDAKIKTAQSEQVALNNKLYSMMSLDVVEQKASKKLHMVKQDGNQVRYVHVNSADNYTDGTTE